MSWHRKVPFSVCGYRPQTSVFAQRKGPFHARSRPAVNHHWWIQVQTCFRFQICVTTKLSNSASTAFPALWAFVPAFTPKPTVPACNGFCVSVTSATT